MRSIAEIKESITTAFMANEDVQKIYGFKAGDRFSDHFGRLSVENVLMYVVAVCCHVVEGLMDNHRNEVDEMLESRLPHRLRWYRDRVLEFMDGVAVDANSGKYDTTGMSDEDIAEARVVKYAAVSERIEDGVLQIKVAGEGADGKRCPLDDETEKQLKAYIGEIKDAGVRIEIINQTPGLLLAEIDVYYNAIYKEAEVEASCREAAQAYVENLDFDGVLYLAELSDALRGVAGVKTVKILNASVNEIASEEDLVIEAYIRPAAGYYNMEELRINMKVYE